MSSRAHERLHVIRDNARLVFLAVRLAWQASPRLASLAGFLSALSAAMPLVQLWVVARTIDAFTAASGTDSREATWSWLAALALVLGLSAISATSLTAALTLLGDRTTVFITTRLLDATAQWQGLTHFEQPQARDDLNIASANASTAGNELLNQVGPFCVNLATTFTLFVTLTTLHPGLAFLCVALTIPSSLANLRSLQVIYGHTADQSETARRMADTKDFPIRPDWARETAFWELQDRVIERYDMLWSRAIGELSILRMRHLKRLVPLGALERLGIAAIIIYAVQQASTGRISIGDITLYLGAALMLSGNVMFLSSVLSYLPLVMKFLPATQRTLDRGSDLGVPEHPEPWPTNPDSAPTITFDQVSFRYPGTDRLVLEDVSFTVYPGERLALVGQNGAGKSTIVRLMLRMYDPTGGKVCINGVNLRDMDPTELRRNISVVLQDFGRYDLTLRENIAIGDIQATDDDDRIRQAFAEAGGTSVMESLNDDIDAMLGRRFDGRNLSGGEWQKVALARAIYRHANLLILDEPTAALDVQSEYDLYQRFASLTRGATTILISHRFSTVRMADRIVLIEHGRVAETGTHTTLMQLDGAYARMYSAQARHYADAEAAS